MRHAILPAGADRAALPLLAGRALRAFADGYVAILLPAYLLALGFGTWAVSPPRRRPAEAPRSGFRL